MDFPEAQTEGARKVKMASPPGGLATGPCGWIPIRPGWLALTSLPESRPFPAAGNGPGNDKLRR
jgi:hypothetical protein